MNPRILFSVTMFAISLFSMGCVNCRFQAFNESLGPVVPNATPPFIRNEVHLFMMNGADLAEAADMMTLRNLLATRGYAKVYYAQRQDRDWYRSELHTICKEDPSARVILLARGVSAPRVLELAKEAIADGIPVDDLIFLDPVGLNSDLTACLPTHSTSVYSHHHLGAPGLVTHTKVQVPKVGSIALPTHPTTVETIIERLEASCSQVHIPSDNTIPRLPLTDFPDPTPRPLGTPTKIATEPTPALPMPRKEGGQ